jgi:arylsulfatase A-like enzyme
MPLRSRALFGALLLALAVAAPACHRGPQPHGPRNVLWIVVDTLRADHLSLYGYPRPTSPALGAFARQAATFRNARSQASCTFPSVNSMLTSQWPNRFLGQPGDAFGIPAEVPTLAELLKRHGYRTLAVSASAVVRKSPTRFNPTGGFARGFDTFQEDCLWKSADCVNRQARPLLRRGDRPFFLYLHYVDPHGPYDPPPGYERQFARGTSDKPFINQGDPNPIGAWLYAGAPDPKLTPGDVQHLVDLYDDEIRFFDGELAELLQVLETRGLLDDTLIVFAADHGEEFLEHHHIKHCRTLFEASIHTPLVIEVPGLPARDVGEAVENLDIAPTILDLLGIDPAPLHLEGRSLRPLLEGKPSGTDATTSLQFSSQGSLRAVADGQFKLIQDFANGTFTLYDLKADPGETTDVLRRERRTFHRLRETLGAWLAKTEGAGVAGISLRQATEAEKKLQSLGYLE